ncbi:hypothetical protein QWY75_02750 [Pontixanthobacter aestiaquae]|uniref:Erythromycin esterase n=1 Tax=Pontixanthobacter aestiaquae TaxID=1509367 RepID=A0A844ZA17_9SPHN|nr:hypothetical protein [Pontixanthobacter aestiaquae]MDN3645123.1 hypothetical protein [Pontixanthobacter aestiaquae]MXO83877.1 hypothetical protein [Pontixanthobacter aestiaquae]
MIKLHQFLTAAALAYIATTAVRAGDNAPAPAKIEPELIEFSSDGFAGAGAEMLRSALAGAQFIGIGEDHGYAGAPALVAAFAREGKPHGFDYYAIEVGPHSTAWLREKLRSSGVDGYARALEGRPLAIPFLNFREEAEVAAAFTADGKLWGIDQEFIGSPMIHLEWLAERAGSNTDIVIALFEKEKEAFAAGNQTAVLMATADNERWTQLRDIFAADAEALVVIDELKRSQSIYRSIFAGRGLENNLDRVELIREYFLSSYSRAAAGDQSPPKVIFKMGAVHVGHATSPMSTFDIGSLVEGMAAANGMDALHIAYLPVGGEQTAIRPSADGAFTVKPTTRGDTLRASLEAAGVNMTALDEGDGHFVIPLEPVRRSMGNKGLSEADDMFRFLVLGFDYLVTTKAGKPATPLATE